MVDGLREELDDWSERSVPDGLAGLATLADEEFDGVVSASGTTATFVSGRVLHLDGTLEALEDSSLTVKVAPDPELALLAAMTATGGEAQAQYYTEDTGIESVDERLQSGGFTGYVELSENVLSGSYYRLYYGGTARSLAFVGINDDVLTGSEAFDRTLDEVGIYEVVPVDLTVTDLPEPPEPAGAGAGAIQNDDPETTDGSATDDGPATTDDGATSDQPATETAAPDSALQEDGHDTTATSREPSEAEPAASAESTSAAASSASAPGGVEDEVTPSVDSATAATPETDATPGADGASVAGTDGTTAANSDDASAADTTTASAEDTAGPATESTTLAASESEAVDDGNGTATAAGGTGGAPGGADEAGTAEASTDATAPNGASAENAGSETAPDGRDVAQPEDAGGGATGAVDTSGTGDARLGDLIERIDALERQVERLEQERESAVEGGSMDDTGGTTGGQSSSGDERSPTDALSETDCLVRYETRAGGTIDALLEGEATTEAVRENLRIETNTTFDAETTTVDGVPFETFLAGSLERRVVGWLLCDLPTEIVATDGRDALADLVDALPAVDRIGFQETVDLEAIGEEPLEEEAPETVGFDLVAWGSDGHPRVVADLNRSTEPVGEGPVSSLIARGKSVASRTNLAAVLFATDGYYEADARRAVEATTGGGLLARDSRASYVKMTRKRGFHCCLAEAYDEAIHLTVPEL